MSKPQFGHGVEDATVHGFQAVPDIGEGAGDNDAHGIIEVGTSHFLFDIYIFYSFSCHFL